LFKSRTPGQHITFKLKIKYNSPIINGEIIVEAKVTRRKQRLFLGKTVVKNGNGQVIATATGTFMVSDSEAKPR
jgi:acyl-coenzyme A thioesterase PaaI-like protein